NYYWLKEGADLEYVFDESITNYERLIHLLKTTLSQNQVKIQELYNAEKISLAELCQLSQETINLQREEILNQK
ncbi:MAG: hypothetical protein NWQ43_07765, partial [Dolichospermum sp.]|nr:hypothetical protein [Dolichospermum sp.]